MSIRGRSALLASASLAVFWGRRALRLVIGRFDSVRQPLIEIFTTL